MIILSPQQERQQLKKQEIKLQRQSIIEWAFSHTNTSHSKYSSVSHPLFILILSNTIFISSSILFNQYFISSEHQQVHSLSFYIGIALLLYIILMISTRTYQNGPIALYETVWACNLAIMVTAIGLIIERASLIRSSLVYVSVDQLLWYIDLLGYIIRRKFPIGVAKYIIWPQTSRLRLVTTFHHIWFLPLGIWAVSISSPDFSLQVYISSIFMVFISAILGRISTPKQIKTQAQPNKPSKNVYMNINLSWELWKDLNVNIFVRAYKQLPGFIIVIILTCCWTIGNILGFTLFYCIQSMYSLL